MRLLRTLALSAMLSVAAVISANATPVTYTDFVVGSGSLGGVSFTNQLITVTGTANTTNITSPSAGIYVVLTSASLTIGSGSAVNFTDSIQAFDNQSNVVAGFGDVSNNLALTTTYSPVFATYNLQTAFSQSGTAGGAGFAASYNTAGGAFVFNSTTGPGTFTAVLGATATPEPSSLCLLGTGVLGCMGGAVRRFRKT